MFLGATAEGKDENFERIFFSQDRNRICKCYIQPYLMFSRRLVARFELLEVLRDSWDAECKAKPLRKIKFYYNVYRSSWRWLRRIFWGQRFSDWKNQSLINVKLRLFRSKIRAAPASAPVQVVSQNSCEKTNIPQSAACKQRPLNRWNQSPANRINSPLKTTMATSAQHLK